MLLLRGSCIEVMLALNSTAVSKHDVHASTLHVHVCVCVQVAVLAFSLAAVGLCIFSLASRHFNKLTTDIWEHMVEVSAAQALRLPARRVVAVVVLLSHKICFDTVQRDFAVIIRGV